MVFSLSGHSLVQKYMHVRFCWWKDVDIASEAEDLTGEFEVRAIDLPGDTPYEIGIYKNIRNEIHVKADTLGAYLSRFKAVLYQREATPFTGRDMRLRERVFMLYPRNRPSPFPWSIMDEPPFEVEQGTG